MARLSREFFPYRWGIAVILILGFVISAVQPVAVKLSQKIIDELQKGNQSNTEYIHWVSLAIVLIFAISGLAKYFHNSIRRFVANKVVLKLRATLFQKFLIFPQSRIDRSRAGDMLSTIQNDLVTLHTGLDTLCNILKEPFTFIGLIAVAFYCDWLLTLSTLLVAPLVVYLFSRTGKSVKKYSSRNLADFSDLLSLGQEAIVGSRVVKVFRLEPILAEKFAEIQRRYFKTLWKSIRVEEIPTPLVEFIGAILMAVILRFGFYRISNGLMSTGDLVAVIIGVGLAQMPIKQLNNAHLKLKAAEAACDRIFALLDQVDSVREARGRIRVKDFENDISFESVSLTYDDKPALKNISFQVRRGDCVALVGQSGSGKSSIINLLPRLYEVTDGTVALDGVDIRDIYIDDLRALFSFVTQDVFLFNDSIYENIRYGNTFAGSQEVERAAELAHCTDFVSRCPRGFHTKIGDRGVCLSGGERQRVAIARAILRGAPILLLDEATSNLDSQSEAIVQEALDTLMEGKTTFVVAHRLSTVKKADKIFVVEGGTILERGTHQELLARAGVYKDLFERQVTF